LPLVRLADDCTTTFLEPEVLENRKNLLCMIGVPWLPMQAAPCVHTVALLPSAWITVFAGPVVDVE
jgi:hypothetical protein